MTATPPLTFSGRRRRPPWARREQKSWACECRVQSEAPRAARTRCVIGMACFHTSKRRPRQTECERTGWHRSVCFFLACSLAGLEVDHDVRLRVTLRRITTPRCRGALVSPRRLPRSLVRIICPRPRLSSSYTRIRFRRTRRTQRLNEGGEGRFRSGPPGRRGRLRGTRDAMYKEDWYAPPPVSRFKHVSSRESTISTISG